MPPAQFIPLFGTFLMADVELQVPPMSPQVGEALSEEGSSRVDEASAEMQTTDGEHEATDVVEASSEPEPAPDVEDDKPAENGVADEKVATEPQHEPEPVADGALKDEEESVKQPTPTTSPPTSPARKITAKSSVSVKAPASKAAGGAPTPLVKKVRDTSTSHNIAPPLPPRNAQNTRGAHTRLLSLTSVRDVSGCAPRVTRACRQTSLTEVAIHSTLAVHKPAILLRSRLPHSQSFLATVGMLSGRRQYGDKRR